MKENISNKNIKKIPLSKIIQTHPSPQEDKINKFQKLIKIHGQNYFQPIYCEYSKKEDRYYIIDGTHISLAFSRLGYTHISAELREVSLTDKSQLLF